MKQSSIPVFFAAFAFMFMNFQCHKDSSPLAPAHTFSERLSLSPYKKVYAINDTITIQFQTNDKSLFDLLSSSRIKTDTLFLQNTFYYHRYSGNNAQELFANAKVDSAVAVNFKSLYTYYNVLTFNTECNANRYFFKIAFIPTKPGTYSIEPNADLARCPNKQTYQYSTFKYTFDLADCNKDIWQSIPSQSRGGDDHFTDNRIDKKEIFMFKVE